jgi:ATP-binding cassette, subfamily B, bacterial
MASPVKALKKQARGLQVSLEVIIRFREELMHHWPKLVLALLCAIGYTLMRLAEAWPIKFILDNVILDVPLVTPFGWLNSWLGDDRMRVLQLAVGAVLVLAFIKGIFYYGQSVLTSRVGQDVVITIREKLFAHVQRLSLRFHNGTSTGDLLMRFTGDINNLRQLLAASLLSLISESIILIGFVSIMFVMNWRLALVAIITIPIIFGVLVIYSSRIRAAANNQRKREGELGSRLHESLSNIQIVQIFTGERSEEARLAKINKRSLNAGLRATRLEGQLNRWIEIAVAVSMALTLWIGATQVIDGRLSAGELVVFVTYMQSFNRPLRRLSRVAERASKASACVDRITEVLDEVPDIQDGPRDAGILRGEVAYNDVSFAYQEGDQTLTDIDFRVNPGETIALVGGSGAGKSTISSLLPRLYDVTGGSITIDGFDIREFTLHSLRETISIVPQDGALFAGTFRENIAYGNQDATDEEIRAAAKAAYIDEFIMSQPEGYDTLISERGSSLSGGQRQRLAIARAMVKDAPIVILDEPTTGLDAASEQWVTKAMERLLAGRTAIIIAHRLDTIRKADEILVLEQGRIVERGTHDELTSRPGRYRDLYEMQAAPANVTPLMRATS